MGKTGLKKSWKTKIYVKTPLIFRTLMWIALRLGAASHLIGRFQRAKFLWPTKLYCSRCFVGKEILFAVYWRVTLGKTIAPSKRCTIISLSKNYTTMPIILFGEKNPLRQCMG